MAVQMLLIRHAEPVKIVDSDGPADPELSDRGRRQAQLLADFLGSESVAAIYASPKRRARETAEPLARATGAEVVVDDGLIEFDQLATSYIPIEEMRATRDERFLAMLEDDYSLFGIDMEKFRQGVVAAVEAIIASHHGDRVVAVCHGGVINAYMGHIIGVSRNSFFAPDYTSVNRVAASRSGVRSVLRLNEVTHLHGHDLLISTV